MLHGEFSDCYLYEMVFSQKLSSECDAWNVKNAFGIYG